MHPVAPRSPTLRLFKPCLERENGGERGLRWSLEKKKDPVTNDNSAVVRSCQLLLKYPAAIKKTTGRDDTTVL